MRDNLPASMLLYIGLHYLLVSFDVEAPVTAGVLDAVERDPPPGDCAQYSLDVTCSAITRYELLLATPPLAELSRRTWPPPSVHNLLHFRLRPIFSHGTGHGVTAST
jgi:hypothetical protein